jgi:hypothetical protein
MRSIAASSGALAVVIDTYGDQVTLVNTRTDRSIRRVAVGSYPGRGRDRALARDGAQSASAAAIASTASVVTCLGFGPVGVGQVDSFATTVSLGTCTNTC